MAFKHGKNAAALFNTVALTSYLTGGDLAVDIDTADTTTWGNTWKTAIPGQGMAKYSFTGYFDPAFAPTFSAALGGASGLLTVGPAGLATGDRCRMMRVIKTAYAETAPVGDVVGFKFDTLSDTVPGFGQVLASLHEVTGDANGTAVDGGAASTTGGIGHLHVSDVNGSDEVVVTIEDSANGTSGWATIATFTNVDAAGAERIVIAGTIKRYTRAVYDITGTSITLAVALART